MKSTFFAIYPEVFLATSILSFILLSIFFKNTIESRGYQIAQASLLKTAFLICSLFYSRKAHIGTSFLYGTFISDRFSVVLKVLVCISAVAALICSERYNSEIGVDGREFSVLILLSVLGNMILISGGNLVNIFLGMELASITIYGLINAGRYRRKSSLASMRYFVISSLATAMILYGASLLFGVTKTLYINKMSYVIAKLTTVKTINLSYHNYYNIILAVSMVTISVGAFLKLGLAPFHGWVVSLYEDSPTPAVLFMASAGKISIFAFIIRFLLIFNPKIEFRWLIIMIGLMSIATGNITALFEKRVKKVLALSSVANIGFMLLGLVPNSPFSLNSMMLYITSYTIATITVFSIMIAANSIGVRIGDIDDLDKLSVRSPLLSWSFLVSLMSISGIPPLVGFFGKFFVLKALIHSSLSSLVFIILLLSSVGVYYSIRMINQMYFRDHRIRSMTGMIPIELRVFIIVSSILIILTSIAPGMLIYVTDIRI